MTIAISLFVCQIQKLHSEIRSENSKPEEAECLETDLTKAVFKRCGLDKTVFGNTMYRSADLRKSFHFSIEREVNRIAKAKFSTQNIHGLLDKYDLVIE